MSNKDQFNMARIPIRIISYDQKELAQCRELLIDYEGDNPSYNIYLVDQNDRTKLINLTDRIINEAFPSINADKLKITIDGLLNSQTLKDVINDIYKKFIFPEDESGFNYEEDISKVFDSDTVPILLTNKAGDIFLPVTTASNVYDSTGQSIQSRLDAITKLGFASGFVRATTTNQTSFEIEYPFKNYSTQGNYMEVRIGTTFIDKSRYEIVDHKDDNGDITTATLTLLDEYLEYGRAINILYIYNSLSSTGGKLEFMSGALLAIGSTPTSRLEKVSDRYDLDDSSSVASSKAINNLYDEVMDTITNWSPYCIYAVDANKALNAGSMLIVNNDSFVLRDGSKVCVRTTCDTKEGLTIQLNGNVYPIYDNNATLDYTIAAGNLVKLIYSGAESRFYIQSLYDYRLKPNRFMYTAKDQELTISFKGLFYNYNDTIFVYRNGVRLFEFVDYSVNMSKETITLYVRTEEEEKFVFETYMVERR